MHSPGQCDIVLEIGVVVNHVNQGVCTFLRIVEVGLQFQPEQELIHKVVVREAVNGVFVSMYPGSSSLSILLIFLILPLIRLNLCSSLSLTF